MLHNEEESETFFDCVSDVEETTRSSGGDQTPKPVNSDAKCTCAPAIHTFDACIILEAITQINLLSHRLIQGIGCLCESNLTAASQTTTTESDYDSSDRCDYPIGFDFPVQYIDPPCPMKRDPYPCMGRQLPAMPCPGMQSDPCGNVGKQFPAYSFSSKYAANRGIFPQKAGPDESDVELNRTVSPDPPRQLSDSALPFPPFPKQEIQYKDTEDPRYTATQTVSGRDLANLEESGQRSIQQQQQPEEEEEELQGQEQPYNIPKDKLQTSDDDGGSTDTNKPVEDDCGECPENMEFENTTEYPCSEEINTEQQEECLHTNEESVEYPTSKTNMTCEEEQVKSKICHELLPNLYAAYTTENRQIECSEKGAQPMQTPSKHRKPCQYPTYYRRQEPCIKQSQSPFCTQQTQSPFCTQQTQTTRSLLQTCRSAKRDYFKAAEYSKTKVQSCSQTGASLSMTKRSQEKSFQRRPPCPVHGKKKKIVVCSCPDEDDEVFFSARSDITECETEIDPKKQKSMMQYQSSCVQSANMGGVQGSTTATRINRREVLQDGDVVQILEYAINIIKGKTCDQQRPPPTKPCQAPCSEKTHSDVKIICPPRVLKSDGEIREQASAQQRSHPYGDGSDPDPRPHSDASESLSQEENDVSNCSEHKTETARMEETECLENSTTPCEGQESSSPQRQQQPIGGQEPCNLPPDMKCIPICQLPLMTVLPNMQSAGPCYIVCGIPPCQSSEGAKTSDAERQEHSLEQGENVEELNEECEDTQVVCVEEERTERVVEGPSEVRESTEISVIKGDGVEECENGEVTMVTVIDTDCLVTGTEITEISECQDYEEIFECTGSTAECKCCYCRAIREQKGQYTDLATVDPCGGGGDVQCREACLEMKHFVDSLLMNIEAMDQTRRVPKLELPINNSVLIQKPEPLRKSFPVTIKEVTCLGKKSLFIKWTIHDCFGIGGYEIYTDSYLTNRYYHPGHESAVICDVDVSKPHKIILVAKPLMEDNRQTELQCMKRQSIMDSQNQCCDEKLDSSFSRPPSSLWIPSIYLYDPSPHKTPSRCLD